MTISDLLEAIATCRQLDDDIVVRDTRTGKEYTISGVNKVGSVVTRLVLDIETEPDEEQSNG